MTAAKFVIELNEVVDLLNTSERGIAILDHISMKKRRMDYNNEIAALINNYDVELGKFGDFSLFSRLQVNENFFFFGTFDGDYLGISRKNQGISIVESSAQFHVLVDCALSDRHFLDIFYVYVVRYLHFLKGLSFSLPEKQILIDYCGGDQFSAFVRYIFPDLE
ncbi:MAG: hypothetical protein DI535_14060 [Citrobacter freundii]|nr:MAG: hypothetical protein DI535_14060 [Citrobacter freundii]